MSPYLLQHSRNPVDWYPFGEEAIERARSEDRPLFVSIGYATCYWCHVMERESFEDEATAELLNRLFVPVKVDREVRPDIDEVYMAACQAFTRSTEGRASGGWPLSVFVEPRSLKPFYVGTYFPPEPMHGRAAFRDVLASLADAWSRRRDEVVEQAERLAAIVAEELAPAARPRVDLGPEVVDRGVMSLLQLADRSRGGFGGAPKFPQPAFLMLLERRVDHPETSQHLRRTLDAMAIGGLFDQVDGGFHRYAVDGAWSVPHFEKMLYDGAQLAPLYARSFARNGDRFHAEIARRTCDWTLRRMRTADGLFASALDAEVNAREGEHVVWRPGEIDSALQEAGRADLVPVATELFGLDRPPTFHDPHHPDAPPAFVLRLDRRPDAASDRVRAELHEILGLVRDRRPQPLRDDKAITSWNGLMIAALVECGTLLDEPRFIDAAEAACVALDRAARLPNGHLARIVRTGQASTPACLEDYACVALAHASVAAAGRSPAHHEARALEALRAASRRCGNPRGGWFDVDAEASELFVRPCNAHDGAVPCGTSLMLWAALAGGPWTDERAFVVREALDSLSEQLASYPVSLALATAALDRVLVERPGLASVADGDTGRRARDVEDISLSIEEGLRRGADGVVEGTLLLTLPPGLHVATSGQGGLRVSVVRADGDLADGDPVEWGVDASHPLPGGGWGAHGDVRIRFRVHRPDDGRLELAVDCQPCDERACHAPRRLRATGTIPPRP